MNPMPEARNPFFPFHALGFRGNPFRALTDEEWAETAILPAVVTEALPKGEHLQIMGSAGSGKTTTLLALQRHFQERGLRTAYEYLPDGATTCRTDPRSLEVFLLDEAQRLSRGARTRLISAVRASGTRLVLGTHRDLSACFAAEMPVTTVLLVVPSPARLRQILHRRMAFFALHPGAAPPISDDALETLLRACGGNLRAMEHGLYEAFQAWARAGQMPGILTAAVLTPFFEA